MKIEITRILCVYDNTTENIAKNKENNFFFNFLFIIKKTKKLQKKKPTRKKLGKYRKK